MGYDITCTEWFASKYPFHCKWDFFVKKSSSSVKGHVLSLSWIFEEIDQTTIVQVEFLFLKKLSAAKN